MNLSNKMSNCVLVEFSWIVSLWIQFGQFLINFHGWLVLHCAMRRTETLLVLLCFLFSSNLLYNYVIYRGRASDWLVGLFFILLLKGGSKKESPCNFVLIKHLNLISFAYSPIWKMMMMWGLYWNPYQLSQLVEHWVGTSCSTWSSFNGNQLSSRVSIQL